MPRTGTDARPDGDSPAAQRIRAAAVAEFARHGYGASTTRGIAARLGLSAAALYPHYASKQDVLYAISLEGHVDAMAALRAADDPTLTPAARLRSVVATFVRWQADNSELARVVQYEIRSLTPAQLRRIGRVRHDTSRVLAEILRAGSQAGEFELPDLDGGLLAISSLCVDVCRWFPSRTMKDSRVLGELYADLALRMTRSNSCH